MEPEPTLEDLASGAFNAGVKEAATESVAKSTTEGTETAKTDSQETKQEAKQDDAGTTATEETGQDDGGNEFFEWAKQITGEDLRTINADPEEVMKSLAEARKLVGRREEMAAYGKAMMEMVGGRENDLKAFLSGIGTTETKKEQKPKSGPRELEDFPEDARDWGRLITQDKNGEYVPVSGAPKDIVSDYREYLAARERRLDQIARGWNKISELPKELESKVGEIGATVAQQREAAVIESIQSPYKSVLYINGQDGALTPTGAKVNDEYMRLSERYPNSSPAMWLEDALKSVLSGGRTAFKTPARPPAKSVKQTGVNADRDARAVYRDEDDEISQRIEKNPDDFDKILAEIANRRNSKSLG